MMSIYGRLKKTKKQKTKKKKSVVLTAFLYREEIDDLAAFQRQYDNDHSWEDLREDEFGRLLSLVGIWAAKPSPKL